MLAILIAFLLGFSTAVLGFVLVARRQFRNGATITYGHPVGGAENVKVQAGEHAVAVLNADDPARRRVVEDARQRAV